MRNKNTSLPPDEHDPNLLHRLFFVQQVCLILAGQIALIALVGQSTQLHSVLPEGLVQLHPTTAFGELLSVMALVLSEPERSKEMRWTGKVLALVVGMVATLSVAEHLILRSALPVPMIAGAQLPAVANPPSIASPLALFLLAWILLIGNARPVVLQRVADVLAVAYSFVILALLLIAVFALAGLPGAAVHSLVSEENLTCLSLLAVVVVLRRSENGIFRIFLGYGVGSRLSRRLTPLALLIPPLRELLRGRMAAGRLFATQYASAILTACGAMIAMVLLVWLAKRINAMQAEIQGLSLRDELTGLHNVRGFNLLAEQALRLARRAKQPFAVLYIDLDNLKVINDQLGHDAGSTALVEMAHLLNETFRETDVIGRVGGDEFLVAGQFDEHAIEVAIDRLRVSAMERQPKSESIETLSFSCGSSTLRPDPRETLKDLVSRADEAMYDQKRLKKPAVA